MNKWLILLESTTHGDGPRYPELCLTPSELGDMDGQRWDCRKKNKFCQYLIKGFL